MISSAIVLIVVFATATSRSDTEPAAGPSTTEPVTEAAPAWSGPPRANPFKPYDIGPPEAAWPYESLTADEKRVADEAHNQDFTAVHDGYAAAVRVRSAQAGAEAAAIEMGIESLAEMGVVP